MIEHSGDLEVMDRDNKVTWSATMGIWPCRARDFVTHIRRATLADSSVAIINFATTHPKVRFFNNQNVVSISALRLISWHALMGRSCATINNSLSIMAPIRIFCWSFGPRVWRQKVCQI